MAIRADNPSDSKKYIIYKIRYYFLYEILQEKLGE